MAAMEGNAYRRASGEPRVGAKRAPPLRDPVSEGAVRASPDRNPPMATFKCPVSTCSRLTRVPLRPDGRAGGRPTCHRCNQSMVLEEGAVRASSTLDQDVDYWMSMFNGDAERAIDNLTQCMNAESKWGHWKEVGLLRKVRDEIRRRSGAMMNLAADLNGGRPLRESSGKREFPGPVILRWETDDMEGPRPFMKVTLECEAAGSAADAAATEALGHLKHVMGAFSRCGSRVTKADYEGIEFCHRGIYYRQSKAGDIAKAMNRIEEEREVGMSVPGTWVAEFEVRKPVLKMFVHDAAVYENSHSMCVAHIPTSAYAPGDG